MPTFYSSTCLRSDTAAFCVADITYGRRGSIVSSAEAAAFDKQDLRICDNTDKYKLCLFNKAYVGAVYK